MKRTLTAVVLLSLLLPAVSWAAPATQTETLKRRVKSWAAGEEWSMSGGYSLVTFEDPVWKDMLDKDSLPLLRFGFGWYPLPNLALDLSLGGMYEKAEAVGSISGTRSGEEYELYLFPVEAGVRYRFRFLEKQWIVPSVFAGYEWWYFKEDPDGGDVVEGDKTGWRYGADIGFLLDPLDPVSAHRLKLDWNVSDTYLCLGYEVLAMNAESGLDFSGELITLGLRFDLGPSAHAKP